MPDLLFILPIATMVPVALAVGLTVVLTARKRGTSALVLLWQLLFVTYLAGLIAATFFPFQVRLGKYAGTAEWWTSINWAPIITIDPETFLLNVLLTVPLGVFIPVLWKWRGARAVVTAGFTVSLGIEVTQYVFVRLFSTGRTPDINDVIANTLGVALGYLVYRLAVRWVAVARWVPGSHLSMYPVASPTPR